MMRTSFGVGALAHPLATQLIRVGSVLIYKAKPLGSSLWLYASPQGAVEPSGSGSYLRCQDRRGFFSGSGGVIGPIKLRKLGTV